MNNISKCTYITGVNDQCGELAKYWYIANQVKYDLKFIRCRCEKHKDKIPESRKFSSREEVEVWQVMNE